MKYLKDLPQLDRIEYNVEKSIILKNTYLVMISCLVVLNFAAIMFIYAILFSNNPIGFEIARNGRIVEIICYTFFIINLAVGIYKLYSLNKKYKKKYWESENER